MQPNKAEAARRQLGTALHLWLMDGDPTSVHVLACGGGELADALAKEAAGKPISELALEVHSDLTPKAFHIARTEFWNAMKHAYKFDGTLRDDELILATDLEAENEVRLGAAWSDLSQVGIPLPVEAQVFHLWFFAKNVDLTQLGGDWHEQLFPGLQSMRRPEQKEILKQRIAEWRTDAELLADARTDTRSLIVTTIA